MGGLTPKAVILIATRGTADGTAADGSGFYYGISDGTSSFSSASEDEHNQDTSDARQDEDNSNILVIYDGTADTGVDGIAAFSAFITNGVTINWTDAPSAGWLLTAIFFAGTDLSAYANYKDLGTGTSELDINTVGFEPDNVICFFKGSVNNHNPGSQLSNASSCTPGTPA